jgi:glutamate/tyrosine decarboxylase-like PLP-dependent enzyme
VPDPVTDKGKLGGVMRLVEREVEAYLEAIDAAPVRPPGDGELPASFPAEGAGTMRAVSELIAAAQEGAIRSAGPRYFHFVTGGVTPAALAADWLTSAIDQTGFNWISSPLASRLEQISLDWLKELFGIPMGWSAVTTTGATASNFVGLAAARRWWGLQQGIDIDTSGMAGLPAVPVFASGYLHASAIKALGMLGIGRQQPHVLTRDAAGRLDVSALAAGLRSLGGKPAIVIATAGDVNTGDFDPLKEMVALAREHKAWLHVDGAFGLFAAVSPLTRHLTEGIEAADSIAVDGHKWLNVAYDTGFAFVRDPDIHAGAFSSSAAYLGTEALARPVFGNLAPEMSRRARALPVWEIGRAHV